jgi:hypothetical protein
MRRLLRDAGQAGAQFLNNGWEEAGEVLVGFEAFTDGLQQGEGEGSAEVFAEFLEAVDDGGLAIWEGDLEFG